MVPPFEWGLWRSEAALFDSKSSIASLKRGSALNPRAEAARQKSRVQP